MVLTGACPRQPLRALNITLIFVAAYQTVGYGMLPPYLRKWAFLRDFSGDRLKTHGAPASPLRDRDIS